ncbi:MAG: hypothetical protein A2Y33_08125 [Spirochaetes bacterium GWF1_51_8]|nr:MAG: hypothetical protein A2Y33_08125 [Spirochaetes bacterium GWF1_51_8]
MKRILAIYLLIGCVPILLSAMGEKQRKPQPVTVDVEMKDKGNPGADYWEEFWDNAQLSQGAAEKIYMEALDLMESGNKKAALEKFRFLIESDVDDKYIYYHMLGIYTNLAAKKPDKALAKEGLGYIANAVKKYPGEIGFLHIWMEFARGIGDEKEFMKAANAVLEKDKNDKRANYYLGSLFYASGQLDKAQPYLETVVASPIVDANFDFIAQYYSFYSLGNIAIRNMKYQDAIHYFEKAQELYSGDSSLIQYLALVHAIRLNFKDSADYLRQLPQSGWTTEIAEIAAAVYFAGDLPQVKDAVAKFSKKSLFVESIGEYLKGNYTNSIKLVQKYIGKTKTEDFYTHYVVYKSYEALKLSDEMFREAFVLGKKAQEVQRYDLAIFYYKKIEHITNLIPGIYWLIGSVYDDHASYDNAIQYYQKYLSSPGELEYKTIAEMRLSFCYYQKKDTVLAFQEIAKAKKNAVEDSEKYQVFFYSGMLNLEFGKFDEALKDFFGAYDIQKADHRIYYYIGAALVALDRYDEALDYLKIGRKKDPSSSEINNLLAYAYALKGENLDEALKLVNLALITSPDSIAYLDTLGWIYYRMGKIEKAFEVFHQLELRLSELPVVIGIEDIHYHLGVIYEEMGKKETAVSYYMNGLKINPENKKLLDKKVLWEKK